MSSVRRPSISRRHRGVRQVAVKAQPLCVVLQSLAVVVLRAVTPARLEFPRVGLAVQDRQAVVAARGALVAGQQLHAVPGVVLQRRQARRVRLADPLGQGAAHHGVLVVQTAHGAEDVCGTNLHPSLPSLAELLSAAVAVYERQARLVFCGKQGQKRMLTFYRAYANLSVNDVTTTNKEVLQSHVAAGSGETVDPSGVAQTRGQVGSQTGGEVHGHCDQPYLP